MVTEFAINSRYRRFLKNYAIINQEKMRNCLSDLGMVGSKMSNEVKN